MCVCIYVCVCVMNFIINTTFPSSSYLALLAQLQFIILSGFPSTNQNNITHFPIASIHQFTRDEETSRSNIQRLMKEERVLSVESMKHDFSHVDCFLRTDSMKNIVGLLGE